VVQPSLFTLVKRSRWNMCGNFDPLLAVFHYRIRQLCILVQRPWTCCLVDTVVEILEPSFTTLQIRPTGHSYGNNDPSHAEPFYQM
jgi:hypothetical protein